MHQWGREEGCCSAWAELLQGAERACRLQFPIPRVCCLHVGASFQQSLETAQLGAAVGLGAVLCCVLVARERAASLCAPGCPWYSAAPSCCVSHLLLWLEGTWCQLGLAEGHGGGGGVGSRLKVSLPCI